MLKIAPEPLAPLAERFRAVRALTLALAAPLSDADATVQSMPDASPTKWHLAHTTWFFETFVLRDHVPGYHLHDERFPFLFNSYYEAEGRRHARDRRGMITRPTLDEVRAYRAYVDAALVAALPDLPEGARELVALGCHHEEQHQELLVTDILHLFGENPLEPAIWPAAPKVPVAMPGPVRWIDHAGGIVRIGHNGDGFAFARGHATTPCSRRMRSPTAPSPTANGRRSSPTAAIAIPHTGSPTAGPG
jgi:ergothioneine biosynthesis protein EgtB